MESASPLALELQQVSLTYPMPQGKPRLAIQDISIAVQNLPGRGQCSVLLGPSGCGKSTILKLVAGLLEPTQGCIKVWGEEVKGPGSDRGMVFQGYSSFPWLSVLDNVRFGLDLAGKPRKAGDEIALGLIKRVGLEGSEYIYPKNLSGGMRQRVALARTLACRPRIILMDEPFGALDPRTRIDMQDLVASLLTDGDLDATILFVTHDIQEAIFLGDKIIVLSTGPGRVLAELAAPPATQQTRQMLARGEYRDLEQHIIELIYGENGGLVAQAEGQRLLGGKP